MSNVFISYSQPDSSIARDIAVALEERGVAVWLDADTVVAGNDFSAAIAERVASSDAVVLLLSENSKRGRWVERELELIIERAQIVLPVLLDDHGKDNWIWPLVSDRNALTLRDRDVNSLANDIHRWIVSPLVDPSHSAAHERGASEGDSTTVSIKTDTGAVELIITRDFDSYSEADKEKLLAAIHSLMEIGDLKVVRERKG